MRLSKPVLALGIAALLATACEKKPTVSQDRGRDLAPRSEARAADELGTTAARRQAAYAIKIGGEKFAPGAGKARGHSIEGGFAGRDTDRR